MMSTALPRDNQRVDNNNNNEEGSKPDRRCAAGYIFSQSAWLLCIDKTRYYATRGTSVSTSTNTMCKAVDSDMGPSGKQGFPMPPVHCTAGAVTTGQAKVDGASVFIVSLDSAAILDL